MNRWKDIEPYWPCCASGSILVTSQLSEVSRATTSSVELRPLSAEEGADFLLDQIGEDPGSKILRGPAISISRALGGLPLAIVHVGGYIRQSQSSLETCLTLLEKRQSSARLFNEDTTMFQYDKCLRIVHDIALQMLDEDSLRLAQILSMLSPEGVPEKMLSLDHEDPALAFLNANGVSR